MSHAQPPQLLRMLAATFGCSVNDLPSKVSQIMGQPVQPRDGATSEDLLFTIRRALGTPEGEDIIAHAQKMAAANS